ncbi:hypothetical protein HPB50_011158 [Hyalomma asiaticum]|uniref:Uncharacterized protein n=2 Tax=Hyalomma asiaticum TaxID=266040 RepID=A0ACB7TIP9_HYAAI|nr:hypothetical protein HPB50_023865 [Hyalomma asiaticum]KAH6946019.1 hypothetical protein HPB50_011158 [Hyalomma asiaticum]
MDVLQVSPAVHRILMDLVAKDKERSTAGDSVDPVPCKDFPGSSETKKQRCDAVCPGPSQDADGPSVTKKQ